MSDFQKRHEPKTLSDVVLSNMTQMVIFNMIASGQSNTNLLLYGANGTGKTTLARVIIADYFAAHNDNDMCEYINMTRMKDFNKLRNTICLVPLSVSGRHWLLIDEVEKVTNKHLLDELHDIIDNSYNCSFILTTNNKGALPGGIISRCQAIGIEVPSPDMFLSRACAIVHAEGIEATAADVLAVLQQGDADLRGYMFRLEMFCLSRRNAGLIISAPALAPPPPPQQQTTP